MSNDGTHGSPTESIIRICIETHRNGAEIFGNTHGILMLHHR